MRWFDNKKSNVKNTLIPYRLHSVTEDIFDEVVERADGYYLIKRCGEKPFTLGHGEEIYISDGETLIYALPKEQVQEIKLDWIPPNTFGLQDFLGFKTLNAPNLSAKAKVDRRFEFKREYFRGRNVIGSNSITLDLPNINTSREIYLTEVVFNSEEPVRSIDIQRNTAGEVLGWVRIDLPLEFKMGDTLKFNNVSEKYIATIDGISTELDMEKIEIEPCGHLWCRDEFEVSVPLKTLRVLETPRNFDIVIDNDMCMVHWEHVLGAERYEVYLDGVLIETTEYNGYSSTDEYQGYMKVRAVNEYTQSEFTEEIYVKSLPNETFISFIDNEYEKGNHVIKINFADYSEMESHYNIRYSVDGRTEQVIRVEGKDGIGSLYTQVLNIPVITQDISIRVTSVNDIGENDLIPPTVLKIGKQPRWTYNEASKTMLIEWTHTVEEADRYRVKYIIDGQETGSYDVIVETALQGSMKYYLDLEPDSQAVVSIAPVVDGQLHIYTVPTTVSMALDTTLIAPTLRTRKISETSYEFSWEDIYNCEKEFEVVYSISGSAPKKEIITSQSVVATGRRYYFNYEFPEHGYISVKVRMNWELGSSKYSEESIVYYVPASGLPPSYVRRDRTDDGIKIEWEGQQYVKDYEVVKKVGFNTQTEIVTDNHCNLKLDYLQTQHPEPLAPAEMNRWKIDMYPQDNYLGNPDKAWIEGLQPTRSVTVLDRLLSTSLNYGNNYIGHAYAYVFAEKAINIPVVPKSDDEGCLYLNDIKVVERVTSSNSRETILEFVSGWNKIEFIYVEMGGDDGFELGTTISEHEDVKTFTYVDKVVNTRNATVEIKVKTNFLNGVVSEYSNPMIFTPEAGAYNTSTEIKTVTMYEEEVNTATLKLDTSEVYDLTTNSSSVTKIGYKIDSRTSTPYTLEQFPMTIQLSGKDLRTESPYIARIVAANSRQAVDTVTTLSITDATINAEVGTYIKTRCTLPQYIYTEINKVRIVTIGDSITAGHPGHWAETMTGDERSQYQYWLNIRLKGQFEIINKGYGSDTTDDILARFDKDVLGYNASYCIIQGGTNDLYWAMAEASGDKSYLDAKVEQMKNNIIQMSRKCWDNGITPIIGTLIPRTGATGIYKDALYEYNQWIIDYCTGNDNIFYIDFFNAGKEKIPPTPLEDPINPGALNPIYDGDAIYDEFGNLIKQGRGIHPNWEGYRIMGECIPLNIFKTGETGLKLYLDADCTIEEEYNDDDKVNPFYRIDIDGVRRKVTKKIVRYVKNVGNNQNLFVAYSYDNYNIDVKFLDANGRRMDYANGLLPASAVARIEMVFDVYDKDSKASVNLYLASREFKVG